MLRRAAMTAILLLALGVGLTPPALAQENVPQAVTVALSALSTEVGTTIRLSDLASWQWAQKNFPDRSLGCPQPGFSYPQFLTNGYSVELIYNGVLYDYRMTANFETVFRCTPTSGAPGGTPIDVQAPTPTAVPLAPAPTVTPAPATPLPITDVPACPGGLPVRLAAGMQGTSIASGSINVRNAPDLDDANAVIGLLLPGSSFEVLSGPQCADNRTWWQIRTQTAAGLVMGWVIEGDNLEYWLAPTMVVAGQAPITVSNAAQLRMVASGAIVQGVRAARLVPPQSDDILLIDASNGLSLYGGSAVTRAAAALGHADQPALAIAVGPRAGASFLAATVERNPAQDGTALFYLWEIAMPQAPGVAATVRERLGVPLPATPNAIAFSPDGRLIAVSSGDLVPVPEGTLPAPQIVWLWDALSGAQITPALVSGPAADLAFSADGTLLAICVPANGVHVWDVAGAAERVVIPARCGSAGTPSLAFSPDGWRLAIGTVEGRVIVWDVAQGLAQRDLVVGPDAVEHVVFSADGSLLAVGAAVSVWDVASGQRLVDLSAAVGGEISGLAFRYDGTQLIAIGMQGWWAWGAP